MSYFIRLITKNELYKFILVGIVGVGIDYIIYISTNRLGANISIAKGFGFVSGALWAYYVNRIWTFGVGHYDHKQLLGFIGIYFSSLLLNIYSNNKFNFMLENDFYYKVMISFILATLVSALYNFLGLKFIVFRKRR